MTFFFQSIGIPGGISILITLIIYGATAWLLIFIIDRLLTLDTNKQFLLFSLPLVLISLLIAEFAFRAVFKPNLNSSAHTPPLTFTAYPLTYEDAFKLIDPNWVRWGIKTGLFDTTNHKSFIYTIQHKTLSAVPPKYSNAVQEIQATRDYLYRLIPIGHDSSQICDSLIPYVNYGALINKLQKMEYAGNCVTHSEVVKRVLGKRFTVMLHTLHKDSGQLIDHVIDLVYYNINGVEYAVTVDALLGIIAPVKQNGSHYRISELPNIKPFLNYPPVINCKRYTVDTANTYSNVFHDENRKFYTDNGFVYYEDYDDISILAPEMLIENEMPRPQFDSMYCKVLAHVLTKNKPLQILTYK